MADAPQPVPVLVERRFPLKLSQEIPALRRLYDDSKTSRWDPRRDIPWDLMGVDALPPAVRAAAAATWRRRAWVEATALIETPALVVRFCMELGREAETRMFLTVRNTEEAWLIECCDGLARAFASSGSPPPTRPGSDAYAGLFNRSAHRTIFDSRVPLDALVAASCLFEDGLERDLANAHRASTTHPVAAAVLERMAAAKTRHESFARIYLAHRAPGWSDADRTAIADRLAAHVNEVELAGYHLPWLAANAAATESAADAATASVGLGAAAPEVEAAVLRASMGRTRSFLAELGVVVPGFAHSALGRF
jgi:hypothetical protein